MSESNALLEVRDLVVNFKKGRQTVSAVAGVSFDVYRGETLGLVGESGCGKSTTGRAIMRIVEPTEGTVTLDGQVITSMKGRALRLARTRMQMIFQDPISSLNPRRRVRDIVAEPIDCWKTQHFGDRRALRKKLNADLGIDVHVYADPKSGARETRVDLLLNQVGIDPQVYGNRFARQFSGGQCQRISIARSLAMRPSMLICDEMVSALDVSIQAQILNLLEDLKKEYDLTLLFIAHDLAVVKNISDRVAVMYLGKLCEIGPSDVLYSEPAHPYTKFLLGAALAADPNAPRPDDILSGEPPSPLNPPSGCRFRTRCPYATDKCASDEPRMQTLATGHQVACHYPLTIRSKAA